MSTVMVTGGAGFIGSHLCDRLLAEGHRVVTVDDLSTGRIANLGEARGYGRDFTFFNMDIRAEGVRSLFERHRPEVVMHLAANVSVRRSTDDPFFDASVNLLGLLNILECCSATGVRKVVFSSSGGALYGQQRKLPVTEKSASAAKPLSPYGVSKKVAEDYLRFYKSERGVDYTALALGNVYGPRQDPHGEAGVIAIFVDAMLRGDSPTVFGTGEQTRDYVFVDDVVHAFALAMGKGSGKLLNIGTAIETSVNDLCTALSKIVGYEGLVSHGPLPPGEVARISLDPTAAEASMGWRPWTHLEDGLRETVAYLRGD
jgi:UDP-glucose 4-epimerase